MITDELRVITDSREQRGYVYPGSTIGTLRTGDYSVVGYESKVTVERKSLADLFGTLHNEKNRERFRREMIRMSEMDAACIVIEASLAEILEGPPLSRLNPHSVVNTLISWSIRYRIPVWFAGDRENAAALTYRYLQHAVKILKERARA